MLSPIARHDCPRCGKRAPDDLVYCQACTEQDFRDMANEFREAQPRRRPRVVKDPSRSVR